MKSRVAKVCLLLLLGAIVNVAVAWWCVRRFEQHLQANDRSVYTFGPDQAVTIDAQEHSVLLSLDWKAPQSGEFFTYVTERADCIGHGCKVGFYTERWQSAKTGPHPPIRFAGVPVFAQHVEGGWPCRSFDAYRFFNSRQGTYFSTTVHRVVRGIELAPKNSTFAVGVLLPAHPLWPGFAVNTIFYAVILWLLCAAPGRVRRWRRIAQGCVRRVGIGLGGAICAVSADRR